jgi:hypothetical protein
MKIFTITVDKDGFYVRHGVDPETVTVKENNTLTGLCVGNYYKSYINNNPVAQYVRMIKSSGIVEFVKPHFKDNRFTMLEATDEDSTEQCVIHLSVPVPMTGAMFDNEKDLIRSMKFIIGCVRNGRQFKDKHGNMKEGETHPAVGIIDKDAKHAFYYFDLHQKKRFRVDFHFDGNDLVYEAVPLVRKAAPTKPVVRKRQDKERPIRNPIMAEQLKKFTK